MTRPDPLAKLIEQLQRLPGIGAKSAQRLAYHILKTPREDVDRLAGAMHEVKDHVTYCSTCSNITDVDPCFFCTHPESCGPHGSTHYVCDGGVWVEIFLTSASGTSPFGTFAPIRDDARAAGVSGNY